LIDRFGPATRAIALMNSIRIKWIATQVGIEIVLKQGKMIGYFVSDQQSDYQSKRFMSVMVLFKKQSSICKIKEKKPRPA
jgi:transcription-repair coupling factor (superfamily II helicase)